jgi:glucose/arabinose dehydrogenase
MRKLLLSGVIAFLSLPLFAQDFTLELVTSQAGSIVNLAHAGDERMFIVQQNGQIKIMNPDGSILPTPFLNVSSLITSGGEQGLLGLAFAPDYETSGRFYVDYTNTSGDTTIARYTVSSDPNVANTDGTILLTIDQPFSNHNGGNIKFGPDGYLWIGMGDGGSGGDPNANGQNTNVLLGKMLRIDVSGDDYTIPSDNPFAEGGGAGEVWAYGLRNPWKFSFDRETGELWIADVGQSTVEEINKMPSTEAGLNYGWRCYEGNDPYNTSGCGSADDMTFPVATYTHGSGRCSITGGYIYRGASYPNLTGTYFYADYCSGEIGTYHFGQPSGFVTTLDNTFITTFGEDVNGELYVAGSGKIYKIVGEEMGTDDVNQFHISLYPNPAVDVVNMNSNKEIQSVQIFSLEGKLILSLNENLNHINVSSLPQGVYLMKVNSEENTKIIKFTKK